MSSVRRSGGKKRTLKFEKKSGTKDEKEEKVEKIIHKNIDKKKGGLNNGKKNGGSSNVKDEITPNIGKRKSRTSISMDNIMTENEEEAKYLVLGKDLA